MQNITIIKRLNEIKKEYQNDIFLTNKLDTLINELKLEETSKGFTKSEKERLKLALSIQRKMMRTTRRNILALWNYNEKDNMYYWTNTAIMVRLSKQDFFNELKTTDDDITMLDKNNNCYFKWNKRQQDYPKVDSIWLEKNNNAKKVKINVKDFMLFLKVNKEQEILGLKIDDETTITFNRALIYNALILSKVAQKEVATLRYIRNIAPFQFEDNCLCTPLRYDEATANKYLTFNVRG